MGLSRGSPAGKIVKTVVDDSAARFVANGVCKAKGGGRVLAGRTLFGRRSPAAFLFGRPPFFVQSSTLARQAGAGLFPLDRRRRTFAEQFRQPLAAIVQIPWLVTILVAVQHQFALAGDAIGVSGQQPLSPIVRQQRLVANLPTERYPRINLIDVLSAGATAPRITRRQFSRRYRQPTVYHQVFHECRFAVRSKSMCFAAVWRRGTTGHHNDTADGGHVRRRGDVGRRAGHHRRMP